MGSARSIFFRRPAHVGAKLALRPAILMSSPCGDNWMRKKTSTTVHLSSNFLGVVVLPPSQLFTFLPFPWRSDSSSVRSHHKPANRWPYKLVSLENHWVIDLVPVCRTPITREPSPYCGAFRCQKHQDSGRHPYFACVYAQTALFASPAVPGR